MVENHAAAWACIPWKSCIITSILSFVVCVEAIGIPRVREAGCPQSSAKGHLIGVALGQVFANPGAVMGRLWLQGDAVLVCQGHTVDLL